VWVGVAEWTFAGVGEVVHWIVDVYWVQMTDGRRIRVHRRQLRKLEVKSGQSD
jgi:hypothetical protein